jgi:hydroxysqualene dehydroxylase
MNAPSALPGRVHVVGAGLAGLAAAVDLAGAGHAVVLHESGPQAGGRCRSFLDPELGVRIDNGNHLLLSGNASALAYVARIGALDTFDRLPDAAIPFVDLAAGERWTLRPSPGRIPWWIFSATRRVAGTRARDYLAALRLAGAKPEDTVGGLLSRDTILFRRLWEPLAVAALNTAAADASAGLFWRVLADTVGRGATACRPLVPHEGLSESLVDPALAFLARHGADIRFGSRLRALGFAEQLVSELLLDGDSVAVAPQDSVILAVPAAVAPRLVPGLVVPQDYAPIVNAHFRCDAPEGTPLFLGIVGGAAEWVFRKPEVLSVTVSAADRLVGLAAEELRDLLWRDVARALGRPPEAAPPARIVKERRATFRATPAQLRRRPAAATRWANLHLAGDYVETGLPATIEGAIRSGMIAASRVHHRHASTLEPKPGSLPPQPLPTTIEGYQRALP